ncbi:MAG: hypothetical protein AAGA66_09145 [Bacteroidota bacterium]
MDVQAEKLYLIEQLARLQDVRIIQKIKEVLLSSDEGVIGYDVDGSTITKPDLLSRAEASNQAIKEGKTKSIEKVRANMKSW